MERVFKDACWLWQLVRDDLHEKTVTGMNLPPQIFGVEANLSHAYLHASQNLGSDFRCPLTREKHRPECRTHTR
jgi:hypothetical protein